MFLESLFLYVWMECPKGVYNQKRGRAELLQKNWKTILYLLDEAQFVDADTPPKLDLRMEKLAKKKAVHKKKKVKKKSHKTKKDKKKSSKVNSGRKHKK